MCAEYSETRTRTKNCAIIFEINTQGFSSFFFCELTLKYLRSHHICTHIWYKKRQFCRYHAKSCFFCCCLLRSSSFRHTHFLFIYKIFSYMCCCCAAAQRLVPRRVSYMRAILQRKTKNMAQNYFKYYVFVRLGFGVCVFL